MCERRWAGFIDETVWLADAVGAAAGAATIPVTSIADAAAAPSNPHFPGGPTVTLARTASPPGFARVWRAKYILHEADLVATWPVFFMGGNLVIGEPIALHFFELRYRRHAISR